MASVTIGTMTMELSHNEARGLKDALGCMSVSAWRTAGVKEQSIAALDGIYNALDEAMKPAD